LRSPLPTEFTPSVISSVDTDGQNPSVYTDEITDGMLRILKKRSFADVEVIAGIFYRWNHRGIQNVIPVRWRDRFTDENADEITEGFKTSAPYGDVTDSLMKMPMESPRDSKRQHRTVTCPVCRQSSWWNHRRNSPSVKPSVKVNISPLTRPYLPLFLLLLPHLNSPQLQTTSAPKKKNLPLLSTTSHISWSLLVTASVFRFTYGFLSVFVSNSIFLNFNI